MIIEYVEDLNFCYFYSKAPIIDEKYTFLLQDKEIFVYKLESDQEIKKILEKTSMDFQVKNYKRAEIGKIECKHGKDMEITRFNQLPNEGWEELVDCWSCHKNEFKSLKLEKIKIVKNRVLLGDFFCYLPVENIPDCCIKITGQFENNLNPIFYNQLEINQSDESVIFAALHNFFINSYKYYIKIENKNYEIRYFYSCKLIKEKDEYLALKIGFKESKEYQSFLKINEYYENAIYKMILKNTLGIEENGYFFSYITNNTKQ
ncbi:hypothetical protein NUSPORA_00072 [Nucleospora cyclopteri]